MDIRDISTLSQDKLEYEKKELLYKLEQFNKRKDLNLDIEFIKNQIDRQIKSIDVIEYSDKEKQFRQMAILKYSENGRISEITCLEQLKKEKINNGENDLEINKFVSNLIEKLDEYGAARYFPRKQKVVVSNLTNENDCLKMHEEVHAITESIKKITTNETIDVTKTQISNQNINEYKIMSGYANIIIDERGNLVDIKNNQIKEMVTESLATMINNMGDKKHFNEYSIPPKMTSYFSLETPRDMLVIALGDDKFLTNMLRENRDEQLEILNNNLVGKYDSEEISKFDSLLEAHSIRYEDNNYENIVQSGESKEFLAIEEYCSKIFFQRITDEISKDNNNCKDIKEQVAYYYQLVKDHKIKSNLNSLMRNLEKKETTIESNGDEFLISLKEKVDKIQINNIETNKTVKDRDCFEI